MEIEDLVRVVDDLAARLSRLETAPAVRASRETSLVRDPIDAVSDDDGPGSVVYAGAGPWDGGVVAWEMHRPWGEVRDAAGEGSARVLSALGNAVRLRIVAWLLGGERSTAELQGHFDLPSSGQLFHHLKELLAAGVIYQPVRGTYAIRRHHVVAVLAILAATIDLAGPPRDSIQRQEEPA